MNNLQTIDSESNLPPGKRKVENIKRFVSQNLSGNLHAGVVAKKFKLSSSSLHHLFKKYEAQSYRVYLEEVRMNKARELLNVEGIRIKEVMYATGYKNRNTFNNAFKKAFRHPPGHFKK